MKFGVLKLSFLASKMEIARYTHRGRARGKGFTGGTLEPIGLRPGL
jgi:hypothetical protein